MTRVTLTASFDVCEKCHPDYKESNTFEGVFDHCGYMEMCFDEVETPSPADAQCFICGEPIQPLDPSVYPGGTGVPGSLPPLPSKHDGDDGGEISEATRKAISEARLDIDFIHWDDAHTESWANPGVIWSVPVEAIFTVALDGVEPCDAGWNHGTMEVELDEDGILLDYSVGDWTHGKHPNMHTFER